MFFIGYSYVIHSKCGYYFTANNEVILLRLVK